MSNNAWKREKQARRREEDARRDAELHRRARRTLYEKIEEDVKDPDLKEILHDLRQLAEDYDCGDTR
jgi:hypothetical protein